MIKRIIEIILSQNSSIMINTQNIIIDKIYEYLEEDSILRIILDFEKKIYMNKIINMNIIEKRKFNRELLNYQIW